MKAIVLIFVLTVFNVLIEDLLTQSRRPKGE